MVRGFYKGEMCGFRTRHRIVLYLPGSSTRLIHINPSNILHFIFSIVTCKYGGGFFFFFWTGGIGKIEKVEKGGVDVFLSILGHKNFVFRRLTQPIQMS